jgi:hypothetical protein
MGELIVAVAIRLDLTITFHRVQAACQAVQFVRFDIKSRGERIRVLRFRRGS